MLLCRRQISVRSGVGARGGLRSLHTPRLSDEVCTQCLSRNLYQRLALQRPPSAALCCRDLDFDRGPGLPVSRWRARHTLPLETSLLPEDKLTACKSCWGSAGCLSQRCLKDMQTASQTPALLMQVCLGSLPCSAARSHSVLLSWPQACKSHSVAAAAQTEQAADAVFDNPQQFRDRHATSRL